MKPNQIELPNYTRKQELWNCYSHAAGTVFALIAGPFLITKACQTGDAWRIATSCIFILSLILLYTFSALYHGLKPCLGKKVLRIMDHDMVFVLIMGTYTPYCLVGLREFSPGWAYTIWGICIVLGILGIVLNSCDLKKFGIFSMVDYIAMGWIIVISFYPLIQAIGWMPGTFLLLIGGLFYTVGAVLYGMGSKKSFWYHTVFHFFCLAGTIAMFFSLYFCVI